MALDALTGLTTGLDIVGMGMGIYAGLEQAKIAKEEAGVEKNILQAQIDINEQRRKQAEVEARRAQLQNIRSSQMARSMAETAAVSQGAQFGTGLQGGLGQIAGQSNVASQSISQNLSIAERVFSDYAQIDTYKMQLADLGASAAQWQGIGAIGSAISGSAGPLAKGITSLF